MEFTTYCVLVMTTNFLTAQDGVTALMHGAVCGHTAAVEVLVAARADINIGSKVSGIMLNCLTWSLEVFIFDLSLYLQPERCDCTYVGRSLWSYCHAAIFNSSWG